MTSLFAPRGSHDEIENGATFMPKFDADGLIPVIAQDSANNEILMFAWMNEEALARTIETGEAWYWSRSRKSFWRKGETSGQTQTITEMRIDCDQDVLLIKVKVGGDGGACHVGYRSCFFRSIPLTPDAENIKSPLTLQIRDKKLPAHEQE
ncbi:MAG: phosphoribosyl-AMP cyclohydrolase [Parvibaculum sp.]